MGSIQVTKFYLPSGNLLGLLYTLWVEILVFLLAVLMA